MDRQESVIGTFRELYKEVKNLEENMSIYWSQWSPGELMSMQGVEHSFRNNPDMEDLEDILHEEIDLDDVVDDMFNDFLEEDKDNFYATR